jgi:hypothetical protein
MDNNIMKILFILILAGSCLAVGYYYGTHEQDRIWASITYLDSANKINRSLKLIELAKKGSVGEIILAEESYLELTAMSLKDYPLHASDANKEIIIDAISRLKRYKGIKGAEYLK